jgi:V8-like Glu-specific endopeptidase
MAKSKVKKAAGGHTPVSNLAPELMEAVEIKPASKPPASGVDPKEVKPSADGTESVRGRRPRPESAEESTMLQAPATEDLRDVGEASFGAPPPVAETVHGPDDRSQITNTATYPWRASASLLITAADNSQWIGTGWFIGPHTLVTAGHCVHIKGSGVPGRDGWVRRISVMPGRNAATLPYGAVSSSNFRSVSGWTTNGDQNFDYAAIIIPTELGNTVGWFGFGVYSDADLQAATANIAGYPGDKPAGTMWYDARRVASVNSRKVYYDIDTAGGQSGAAAYRIINGGRYAIAIHAYGGATTNSGTRIITDVYNNLVAWRA